MSTSQRVLSVLYWCVFYATGLVGNLVVAVMWAIYSLEISISAPDIATMIHDQSYLNETIPGIKFTGTEFKEQLKEYRRSSRAWNVFGWLMFSFAIVNAISIALGTIPYVWEKFTPAAVDAAEEAEVWGVVLKVLAYIAPFPTAVAGCLQTLSFYGLIITGIFVKVLAVKIFMRYDAFCNEATVASSPWIIPHATPTPPPTLPASWGAAAPTPTPAECGVPDYSVVQPGKDDWISEQLCCKTTNTFCCSFDAPYDWGLAGLPKWQHTDTNPFRNQQRNIRAHASDIDLTRMRYILQPLYVNVGKKLYAQERDPIDYFNMELWILANGFFVAVCSLVYLFKLPRLVKDLTMKGKVQSKVGTLGGSKSKSAVFAAAKRALDGSTGAAGAAGAAGDEFAPLIQRHLALRI